MSGRSPGGWISSTTRYGWNAALRRVLPSPRRSDFYLFHFMDMKERLCMRHTELFIEGDLYIFLGTTEDVSCKEMIQVNEVPSQFGRAIPGRSRTKIWSPYMVHWWNEDTCVTRASRSSLRTLDPLRFGDVISDALRRDLDAPPRAGRQAGVLQL